MISVRRFIASMLAGALLVLVSAAQASAQAGPSLDRAFEGVGVGLAAASEVSQGDVIVVDESLIKAFDAWDRWIEKHPEVKGNGPSNAADVQEALRNGLVPGQIDKETGSKLSHLNGVYGKLKSESDEAKKVKENKGKGNDKDKEDKSKSEASSGDPADDRPSGQSSGNQDKDDD
jgi:hypothetical protein